VKVSELSGFSQSCQLYLMKVEEVKQASASFLHYTVWSYNFCCKFLARLLEYSTGFSKA